MSDLVLDASFIGLINLPDELPPSEAGVLVATLRDRRLHVPSHWHLEVANMLVKAERRGRINRNVRGLILQDIEDFVVLTDRLTSEQAWSEILPLADNHGLTVYDAAYVELAMRLRATLASHDKRLIAAARMLGIRVLTAPA